MIEKKHRTLSSIYLINDAVASNLAMLCAWFLRFSLKIIPVTKGQQEVETYLQLLPIVTIVFPLAFAVQGLYRIRPTRSKRRPEHLPLFPLPTPPPKGDRRLTRQPQTQARKERTIV